MASDGLKYIFHKKNSSQTAEEKAKTAEFLLNWSIFQNQRSSRTRNLRGSGFHSLDVKFGMATQYIGG